MDITIEAKTPNIGDQNLNIHRRNFSRKGREANANRQVFNDINYNNDGRYINNQENRYNNNYFYNDECSREKYYNHYGNQSRPQDQYYCCQQNFQNYKRGHNSRRNSYQGSHY